MASATGLTWRAFHVAKAGNADTDYEDASAADAKSRRFAIADGASEASFAGLWARLLVERFVSSPDKPWRNLDWLDSVRQSWAREVDGMTLPWYAEDKRELGAFATFLGFTARRRADGTRIWRAIAVGDACLFHTRGDGVKRTFPMTQSTDFGNQPGLIGSRRANGAETQKASGRWRPNDRFLLMTDALAQWFLHGLEQQQDPLAQIRELLAGSEPNFAGWVEERRRQSSLRNDDVTLIVVDLT